MTTILFSACFFILIAYSAALHMLLVRVWRESPNWAARNDILRIGDTLTFTPRERVRALYAHLRARAPQLMTQKHAEIIRFLLLRGDCIAILLAAVGLAYHWLTH